MGFKFNLYGVEKKKTEKEKEGYKKGKRKRGKVLAEIC